MTTDRRRDFSLKSSFSLALLMAIALVAHGGDQARAQPYPNRPITMISPFPAGGPNDALARTMAEAMKQVLGQPIIIENIGGASGAMPPVLGWAAMTGEVSAEALILFLIIFLWTPPHFWALALYRTEDYRKSGLPMLPVTHGSEFTRFQILL